MPEVFLSLLGGSFTPFLTKLVPGVSLDYSSFVKEGTPVKRKKKEKTDSWWSNIDDWKALVDQRMQQYQIPADIT